MQQLKSCSIQDFRSALSSATVKMSIDRTDSAACSPKRLVGLSVTVCGFVLPKILQRAGMSGSAHGLVLGHSGPGASPTVSGWRIPLTVPTTAHVPLLPMPLPLWRSSLRLLFHTCCASTPPLCHGRHLQKASPTPEVNRHDVC